MTGNAGKKPSDFARATLPIIFVLDTSGAMHGQPISVLNNSMKRVVKAIGDFGVSNYDVIPYIGILQFHSGAHWTRPDGLIPADKYEFESLDANGLRDMGQALIELNRKLSRKEFLASALSVCKPIIIFMTCGMMTDSVEEPLNHLKTNNRWYQNALKVGFALSEDADIRILSDIVGSSGVVIQTDDYKSFEQIFKEVIVNCFKRVWHDYISDHFDKEHSVEDIVKEVLIESESIEDVKVSVYSGEKMVFDKHNQDDPQAENTDSVLRTMMAYSEIWTILTLLEDSYASRVPQRVKAFFEEERLKDYEPQIDVDKPLTEQNLQRETMVLLAMLNINYWCNSDEEREFWLREMARNDNKEYDPNDTSWDLGHIFGFQEGMDSKNNDEYPTKREEDNHIVIRMPFGNYCLFMDRSYCAPKSMFDNSKSNDEIDAMEFYLFNSWGPRLRITNINIQDLFVCNSQSKKIPLQRNGSVFISEEEKIVDRDGRTIVSFSAPDGWILEEWTDEDW